MLGVLGAGGVTVWEAQPSPPWVLMLFNPSCSQPALLPHGDNPRNPELRSVVSVGTRWPRGQGGWCLVGDAPSSSPQGGRQGVGWGMFHPYHRRDEGKGDQVTRVPVPNTPRRCLFVAQIGLDQASPIPVGHYPLYPCSPHPSPARLHPEPAFPGKPYGD